MLYSAPSRVSVAVKALPTVAFPLVPTTVSVPIPPRAIVPAPAALLISNVPRALPLPSFPTVPAISIAPAPDDIVKLSTPDIPDLAIIFPSIVSPPAALNVVVPMSDSPPAVPLSSTSAVENLSKLPAVVVNVGLTPVMVIA